MRIIADTEFRTQSIYWICIMWGYLRMISYEPLFRTMKEKGISSYRLGKMGFPMSNYYAMKRGENISSHTLNQLCRLLQCRVEDVMEYVEDEPEP